MATQWNFKIQFPTDSNFVNRIMSMSHGPSKRSGNPMYTIECEVVSPQSVDVAGEEVEIAGVKTINYYTTMTIGDVEKSEKNKKRLINNSDETPGLLNILLAEHPDKDDLLANFNPENPDPAIEKWCVGKCVLTQMGPEVQEQRKNPTSEEIQKAKAEKREPVGEVMKNPRTGKPLIGYRPLIREVFCLAPAGAGANVPY